MHGMGVINKMQNTISFLKNKVVRKCQTLANSKSLEMPKHVIVSHQAALGVTRLCCNYLSISSIRL